MTFILGAPGGTVDPSLGNVIGLVLLAVLRGSGGWDLGQGRSRIRDMEGAGQGGDSKVRL